ncbi:alpha/beta hydrolase [Cryptosporangium sp. NPDC051539]|uniref:alpha/beta hydrolase n=1 Tax=Cryptosporangium sp. NPDC051539 TaxID=3363962 RepID=UPI0037A5C68A
MTLPYPTLPGDVDRAVADDHAAVLRLLEHLETGSGYRRTLADQLIRRCSLIFAGMDQVILPELQRHSDYAGPVTTAGALATAGPGAAVEPVSPPRGGPSTIAPDVIVPAAPRPIATILDEVRAGQHASKERLAVLDAAEPGEPEFEQALLRLIEGTRVHVAQIEGELLPALRGAGADVQALGRDYYEARRSAPAHVNPDGAGPSRLVAAVTSVFDGLLGDKSSERDELLATDASGLLDHDAQLVVDAYARLEPRSPDLLTPAEARQQPTFRNVVSAPVPDPAERRTIDGVPVVVFRPAGVEATLPVVVFAHGGGGVVGVAENTTAQALCDQLDCVVLSVDYRLAPEHPFPAGHDDVRAVLEWALANAADLGGDPLQVVAAGESMGANMVASACLAMPPGLRPVAQLLITPVTTASQDTASMLDSADAALLDRPAIDWFLMHLFADPADALDPRFALLDAPAQTLAAAPPTHVITADRDPLRDQGELFAARLAEAGVPATVSRYPGVPHTFFGLGADVQASVQAQLDTAELLRPHLA